MIAYSQKTTSELIDLLITEEDRVTLEHIQELATRPDAIEPLRAWMVDETRWQEAEDGEWWALYHAFTILCLTRRPEVLDDLLQGFAYADKADFDWLTDISPAAFAQFGEAAVEPLIQFISAQASQTDWSVEFRRANLVTALTRIALKSPTVKSRVAEFIRSRLTDPEENAPSFLGLIVDDALALDRESALEPLRATFKRGAIDESISGNYEETLKWFDAHEASDDPKFNQDLLKFYQPQEIASRQARWKSEKEDQERRAKQKEANELVDRIGLYQEEELAVPVGYFQTPEGNLIREEEKVGRNNPCPCGSGKKYKKCHGK